MRGDSRSGFLINAHVLCLQGVGRAAAAEVTYIPAYKATSGTNIGVMNVANRVKGLQQQFKACQPFTSLVLEEGVWEMHCERRANCCVASPRAPSCRTQEANSQVYRHGSFVKLKLPMCPPLVSAFPFLDKTRPSCVPKGTQRPASISHCHGPINCGHWTHIVQPISHGNWKIDKERWLTF